MHKNIDPNWDRDQEENEEFLGGYELLNDLIQQLREVDSVYKISQV